MVRTPLRKRQMMTEGVRAHGPRFPIDKAKCQALAGHALLTLLERTAGAEQSSSRAADSRIIRWKLERSTESRYSPWRPKW